MLDARRCACRSSGFRDRVTVDALRFFGEPLDVARPVRDFAAGLGERFALLGRENLRQILLRLHHQLEPVAKDCERSFAVFCRHSTWARSAASIARRVSAVPHFATCGDRLAGRGIQNTGNVCAAVGIDPLSVDVSLSP